MTEPEAPPAAKESFGRYLAQQRELRGLTLQQIGDATKLSLTTLRALEADDGARLPERVFLVGAVRAYAKAVGLSPEETLLRLHESLGQAPGAVAASPGTRRPGGVGRWAAIAAVVMLALSLAHHFLR